MFRKLTILAAVCTTLPFTACKDKSEAEKAEEERAAVREDKRQKAAEFYRNFAKEYPDDPQAPEAKKKAAELDALAPKK